jgi:hypothetical protein
MEIDIFNKKKIQELQSRFTDTEAEHHKEINTLRIQMLNAVAGKKGFFWYDDTELTDRKSIVEAIAAKYRGQATYGTDLVQRIVNYRAGMITGGGMKPKIISSAMGNEGQNELDFIKEFMEINNLYDFKDQQLGVEKEIEGQILLHLRWDPSRQMSVVYYYPWSSTDYDVILNADFTFRSASWQDGDQPIVVTEDDTAFLKFNSRLSEPNGWPILAGNLQNTDNISKALVDWREINRLFASPTPYFHTDDMREAADLLAYLQTINWKVGKALAGPADMDMKSMAGQGIESLKQELETNLKLLSGGTDVPVQFLGFPEFMTNRATADNTMEPIGVSTTSEQAIWISGMQLIFDLAIRMRNEQVEASAVMLNEGLVEPMIAFVTERQIQRIQDLYLPLWEKRGLTLRTLLEMLPDIPEDEITQVESEAQEREERSTVEVAAILDQARALRGNIPEDEEERNLRVVS